MSEWQKLETAPKDGTHVLLLTHDFGVVEGYWDTLAINFYKSQKGWASYDPDNMLGEWVSYPWTVGNDPKEHRLFCGATACYWMPKPEDAADVANWPWTKGALGESPQ